MDIIKLDVIKKAIDEKKGENIETIDVSDKSPFFTHMIIATIKNSRQGNAIGEEIQKNLSLLNETVRHIEGRDSEWVVIDCHDILVHLFTEEERERINLEQLYKGKK